MIHVPTAAVPLHDPRRALDTPEIRTAISDVLARGHYINGEMLGQFERDFAAYLGTSHCVGVANGTDALEIALRAVGVRPGDRVVTVANAGFYASNAILACGAEPAYVDVDPDSMLMSVDSLRQALDGGPTAVVYTHLYGDISGGQRVAEISEVPVVMDCAHAPGPGAVVGATAAAFSFYPTKNLPAAGDAGAVTCDDPSIAQKVRSLSRYGWSSRFRVERPGRNSRLDELQAAVLLNGLSRLQARTARRMEIRRRYADTVKESAWRIVGHLDEHQAHLAVLAGPEAGSARRVFAEHGIDTDVHYPIPDHRQPGLPSAKDVSLPVTDALVGLHLSIPCFPELADVEVARVIHALRLVVDEP
jgi:dTDP-3-amino-2,3,6-trideoxy-4-keto-D-glucose/dTDP-3-amino-3,4,6-trideoxy-alpha-D-glucose/dTDP-2,6-dideoxy-D-kanosamine transaminase